MRSSRHALLRTLRRIHSRPLIHQLQGWLWSAQRAQCGDAALPVLPHPRGGESNTRKGGQITGKRTGDVEYRSGEGRLAVIG